MAGNNPGTRIEGRIQITGAAAGALGSNTDAPAALPASTIAASMIALLKAIGNQILSLFNINLSFTGSDLGTLSAVGESAPLDLSTLNKNINNHAVTFNIAAIDTTVDLTLEGSVDGGTTFVQLAADGNDTQYSSNGDFILYIDNVPLTDIQLIMKAEAGGANVVISNVDYRGSK